MVEKKRLTAVKISPIDIINGKYIEQDGFLPNYVLTPKGRTVSRVRVMGTLVKKFVNQQNTFASITLDDGLGTIRAKIFNATSLIDGLDEGHLVDVTGKIRDYQGELYINAETVHKISDFNYEILRRLELRQSELELDEIKDNILSLKESVADLEELVNLASSKYNISPELVESILESSSEGGNSDNNIQETKEKIFGLIKKSENGCKYDELIEKTNLPEDVVSEVINKLLSDGECFEPKPGLIRCL